MKTFRFATEVDRALATGLLHEHFRAQDVRGAFEVIE